mmetsp:Transcript_48057/g.153738  ORF Transcript_48057/g.153738 Transcript_48057/m.153738 type:complete len:144 (-) Transcript_48057:47-478(-)
MLVDEERIRTYLCDATSGAGSGEQQSDGAGCPSWQADSAFDVIVDDASHDVGSQLDTFDHVYKFLRPGGYHVIEDVLTMSLPIFQPLVSAGIATWNNTNSPNVFNGNLDDSNILIIQKVGEVSDDEEMQRWLHWAKGTLDVGA